MEEAKALVNWDAIKDHIRNEEHGRSTEDKMGSSPLDSLSQEQLFHVKEKYEKLTPYIRTTFIGMTLLVGTSLKNMTPNFSQLFFYFTISL